MKPNRRESNPASQVDLFYNKSGTIGNCFIEITVRNTPYNKLLAYYK